MSKIISSLLTLLMTSTCIQASAAQGLNEEELLKTVMALSKAEADGDKELEENLRAIVVLEMTHHAEPQEPQPHTDYADFLSPEELEQARMNTLFYEAKYAFKKKFTPAEIALLTQTVNKLKSQPQNQDVHAYIVLSVCIATRH